MAGNDARERTGDRTGGGLPDDVVEHLLSSERRRQMIACLVDSGGELPVTDLAERVAARERGAEPDAVEDERQREVCDEMYRVHLPKLTATEVAAYDSLVGSVRLLTDGERLLAAVESSDSR